MSLCALPHRSVIGVSGPDAASFLQGLISNDIAGATPKQAIYAALLTPQGKFLYDLFIIANDDGFLLDCEAVRVEQLLALLNRYKLRAQLKIVDLTQCYQVYSNLKPQPLAKGISFNDPRLPELGTRHFVTDNPTVTASLVDYDRQRLQLGVADGSRDLDVEKDILLEANFDLLHGINWSKGCYVGQELTARTHYRGLVKKRLFPVTIDGAVPPSGSIIRLDGHDIGELRGTSGLHGLALLRVAEAKKVAHEKTPMIADGAKLQVSLPHWMVLP